MLLEMLFGFFASWEGSKGSLQFQQNQQLIHTRRAHRTDLLADPQHRFQFPALLSWSLVNTVRSCFGAHKDPHRTAAS